MKILIKKATIICLQAACHGQRLDLLIVDGKIQKISPEIDSVADQIIEAENLHVSIGWMDLFAHFCDPGFEQSETLETGAFAAAAGGFTDVLIIPNTHPTLTSKTQIEYIIQKAAALPVSIHPMGAVTQNTEGKVLAEMYDMYESGVRVFSDGLHSIQEPGMLIKALQYVLKMNGTIIQLPNDKSIHPHGLMNEGIISTRLGLPGNPAIAEELMISRDIELVKYTQSKLHITGITTRRGIEMVMKAKEEGYAVTCSATPYHLNFCDEDLHDYNTVLKVNPPLRTRKDMMALRESFRNGSIEAIATHHTPVTHDEKACEFEYAKNGMTGLESLFGSVNVHSENLDQLINQLTIQPRIIAGIPLPEIKEGAEACLTLFDPHLTYTFDASMVRSLSKNNPFIGKQLKGKVLGIINKNKHYIHTI